VTEAPEHRITLGLTRKSLEGVVIYACPQCGGLRRKDRFLGELSASLPLWLWQAVLALKWCAIKSMKLFT